MVSLVGSSTLETFYACLKVKVAFFLIHVKEGLEEGEIVLLDVEIHFVVMSTQKRIEWEKVLFGSRRID